MYSCLNKIYMIASFIFSGCDQFKCSCLITAPSCLTLCTLGKINTNKQKKSTASLSSLTSNLGEGIFGQMYYNSNESKHVCFLTSHNYLTPEWLGERECEQPELLITGRRSVTHCTPSTGNKQSSM